MDRRRLLSWMIGAPLLATTARVAEAGPRAGAVLDGKTRAPLRILTRAVFSISNANDRFVAVVELTREVKDPPLLVLARGKRSANSWGSGFGTGAGAASFEVDRTTADAIAALWRVPRRDRVPIGGGLVGRWRALTQPFAVGGPMELELDVENAGADTAYFSVGGRQRGPRDNRFSFDVSRGGRALAILDAMDLGGLMQYEELAPGAHRRLTVDLASWVTIDRPGTYAVVCRYAAEVVPSRASPRWPEHGHETWDLTLTAPLSIIVR